MPGPGFARPDLCSIPDADGQEELAEAVRGGFSADGYPLGDDDRPAPLTSGVDRAIRLSTALAVLAVAGIAAYVSCWLRCSDAHPAAGRERESLTHGKHHRIQDSPRAPVMA